MGEPLVLPYTEHFHTIISDAEDSYKAEINYKTAEQQYKIASHIYRSSHQMQHADKQYRIKSKAVDLHVIGKHFQMIDLAAGTEFNTLKQQPNAKHICQIAAYQIVKMELLRMLTGQPFDPDRHGGQSCVDYSKCGSNQFDIMISHFDFGEIPVLPSTKQELLVCQQISRDLIISSLFSVNSLDFNTAIQKVNTFMNQYSGPKKDLIRLRQIRKGLVALQDYFQVLNTAPELIAQLKWDVLKGYGIYEAKTTSHDFFSSVLTLFGGSSASFVYEALAGSYNVKP